MRAGAVHGTGEYAVADIHHPRGLHGLDGVLWQGRNRWSGCVSRDVLADCGADFQGHTCSQLGPHAATDHCQTKRESIGETNYKSHYDSRSAYASSNNSSNSAVCGAQSRAHDVPHIGIVVSALYCKPDQHGHL